MPHWLYCHRRMWLWCETNALLNPAPTSVHIRASEQYQCCALVEAWVYYGQTRTTVMRRSGTVSGSHDMTVYGDLPYPKIWCCEDFYVRLIDPHQAYVTTGWKRSCTHSSAGPHFLDRISAASSTSIGVNYKLWALWFVVGHATHRLHITVYTKGAGSTKKIIVIWITVARELMATMKLKKKLYWRYELADDLDGGKVEPRRQANLI